MSGGRPPRYPAGHPLASDYMKRKEETLAAPPSPTAFQPTTFAAFISPSSMRFNKDGQFIFEVAVTGSAIDDALELRHLAGQIIPMQLSVEIHPEFVERLAADNLRLLGNG